MNTNDFFSDSNKYIENCFKENASFKSDLKEIFIFFDDLCHKNGITYFLLFGSLLGACRDKQLLPWDIDIDVGIFYSERELLIEALKNNCRDKFYFSWEDNIDSHLFMIRISKIGYNIDSFHLDIFYLAYASNDLQQRLKMQKNIKDLYKRRNVLLLSKKKLRFLDRVSVTWYILKKININLSNINKYCHRIMTMNKTNYVIVFGENAEIFNADIFSGIKRLNFDGIAADIPIDSNQFLLARYGDYFRYNSIEQRFIEFLESTLRVKDDIKKI